jgi:hypothetical protein
MQGVPGMMSLALSTVLAEANAAPMFLTVHA